MFDQTNRYIIVKNSITGEDEHIFDDTPIRYMENGTKMDYCFNDAEETEGRILDSGSIMMRQKSCEPNTGNAGNYYTYAAATVMRKTNNNSVVYSSICPLGWKLPEAQIDSKYTFEYLFNKIYNLENGNNNGSANYLPTSYTFTGRSYYGQGRDWHGQRGFYWTSKTTHDYSWIANIGNSIVEHQTYWDIASISLRCVAELLFCSHSIFACPPALKML